MLAKWFRNLETMQPSNCADSEKVNIGGGVLVERTTLRRLWKVCSGSPAKYARALLQVVFSLDELKGKSFYGQRSNAHNMAAKDTLDPVCLGAVVGYTCVKFPAASDHQLKNSLSSMLAREIM